MTSPARPPGEPAASDGDQAGHIADLRAVLEVTRELASTSDLSALLRTVEKAALSVLECERATVFLYDRDRHELYSRLATGVDAIRFSADRGIAGQVVRTGEVIDVPDAYADPRFNPEIDRQTGFRTRNMITFPLLGFDNTVVGVLQVLNKSRGDFDPWDSELVRTFGAQVGVALQRQLLLEHFAEKKRLERDLNIARDIQQGLLPDADPCVPGYDIAGWNKPADATGGDCYDYLALPDGCLALTIADATGHGIGPALMIAECRALFRASMSLTHDLTAVVGRVNNLLCEDLPDDRFVTAFFGLLDPAAHVLSWISAGHGPLIKYLRAEDRIVELKANGMPLGIVSDVPFSEVDRFEMRPGDMMAVVTDGFFEWARPDKELFGLERTYHILRASRDRPAGEIIRTLHEAVLEFARGTPQADDLTAVVIKRL
jgi:phosphoserine phosphatase